MMPAEIPITGRFMNNLHRRAAVQRVLANPDAVAVIQQLAPEVLSSPMLTELASFPFGSSIGMMLGGSDSRIGAILNEIETLPDLTPQPSWAPAIEPNLDLEGPETPRGSAQSHLPAEGFVHERLEFEFIGPKHGNPFVDVEFGAVFESGNVRVSVGGFYNGDGRYVLRFLPTVAGTWELQTHSTSRSLDGITATVTVKDGPAAGPVRVQDSRHFGFPDGKPFVPIGTTAYAWTHQSEALQDSTLTTLASTPFNKIRMALFPKHFRHNSNEPELFVFPRAEAGWDTTRFDLVYFARLERRIEQLLELGIQADLILFHPYDRWGFAELGPAADDRYVKYVVRRLAAFPNVWWSMANEYDLLLAKSEADWNRLGELVVREDHVAHPVSIHQWLEMFDNSAGWVTHCSIQNSEDRIGELIAEWQQRWRKPVVVDEFGYEGDLDQGWGNLTAETVVRRFWDGTMRDASMTHGETFLNDADEIWWSKGGVLVGESVERISFLQFLVSESPTGRLEPLPSEWDCAWAGASGEYVILYFGARRPRFRDVPIPAGMRATIDVIDTWGMTIQAIPGTHEGTIRVPLPARPYMAIRLKASSRGEEQASSQSG